MQTRTVIRLKSGSVLMISLYLTLLTGVLGIVIIKATILIRDAACMYERTLIDKYNMQLLLLLGKKYIQQQGVNNSSQKGEQRVIFDGILRIDERYSIQGLIEIKSVKKGYQVIATIIKGDGSKKTDNKFFSNV